MGLQAMVLKYRDAIFGPEAIVIVEVAEKGGHKGVFFVLRSVACEGLRKHQISTFIARADAEACFGGQEHSAPAYQICTTDTALHELVKRSIGEPAGKPPGDVVTETSSGIVGVCFFSTVLHREHSFCE